jgi:alpha-N-arabinofuranosidase
MNSEPRTYHISVNGDDSNEGSAQAPLRTTSAAAQQAQPGDVITIHEGTYREWIDPPQGGSSDSERIVYQAADDADVELKGSEVIERWKQVDDSVWKVTLSNDFFGEYNPYSDRIRGDWFDDKGRDHHTGEVYLNGVALTEAATLDAVKNGDSDQRTWYGEVDTNRTTIWARFGGDDPNQELVEINVRPAVFYPSEPGIDYITVRGLKLRHAATQWAPPTTEQIGLVGTHWSKGWIIENNVISDSRCTGITLGKYGESIDDTGASAERYNQTIENGREHGWEKGVVGDHVVRNNTICNCEQAGIVGSMGAAFSEVIGNHIYNINRRGQFSGAEIAGIKFHGPIDSRIRNNRVHHARRGIWLDWMTQGTRATGNLLYGNDTDDLFVEVNHGPFVVDNNIFFSETALRNWSEGGAYVHNLIAGDVIQQPELDRSTPFHVPHSTEIAGLSNIEGGDDRFYNNVFIDHNGLSTYDETALPVWMEGNVFLDDSSLSKHDNAPLKSPENPDVELVEEGGQVSLSVKVPEAWRAAEKQEFLTTQTLGDARIPDSPFENPDGTPLRIDTDYFGDERDTNDPTPGPFAHLEDGRLDIQVWPS